MHFVCCCYGKKGESAFLGPYGNFEPADHGLNRTLLNGPEEPDAQRVHDRQPVLLSHNAPDANKTAAGDAAAVLGTIGKKITALGTTDHIASISSISAATGIKAASAVLETVPVLGATLKGIAAILGAKHTDEITRNKCAEVERYIQEIVGDVQNSSDDGFVQLIIDKLEELNTVVKGILSRSKAMRAACSFAQTDLNKIRHIREEINQYQTAALHRQQLSKEQREQHPDEEGDDKTKHNIPFMPDKNYVEHEDHARSGSSLISRLRGALLKEGKQEQEEGRGKGTVETVSLEQEGKQEEEEGGGQGTVETVSLEQEGTCGYTMLTQVAAAGLGGIGKTAAVVQVVHAEVERGTFDYILWASAESTVTLQNDFAQIARALLKLPAALAPGADAKLCRELVVGWMQQTDKRWLLVLDNADALDPVRDYMPTSAQPGCGHVVMTTRVSEEHLKTELKKRKFTTLTLETLSSAESKGLLLQGTGCSSGAALPMDELKALDEIVAELDGLPLALVQAASLMQVRACSFSKYLVRYQQVRTEIFHSHTVRAAINGVRESVATTWKLSAETLKPAEEELLQVLSLLAADSIPREFVVAVGQRMDVSSYLHKHFAGVGGDGEWETDELLDALQRLSFVSHTANKTISMHRLLQQVQRDEMKHTLEDEAKHRMGLACAQAVASQVQDARVDKYTLSVSVGEANMRWLSHVLELAKHVWRREWLQEGCEAAQEANTSIQRLVMQVQYETAVLLTHLRDDPDGAEAMYKRVLEVDPNHAEALNGYAFMLANVRGDSDGAEAMYKRVLEIDPSHAKALNGYAFVLTTVRGDSDGAEAMYKRLLEVDPDNIDTLNGYAFMLTTVRGDYSGAATMYTRVLEIDPNHVSTLCNYAIILKDMLSDEDGAEAMYKRVLEIDPSHAEALNSYALILKNVRGDSDGAEAMHKRCETKGRHNFIYS
jgi:tetratricopeptide (TPR) repeat protein